MNENDNPIDLMRRALATRWQYGTQSENDMNQRDIQYYALASIAESAVSMAEKMALIEKHLASIAAALNEEANESSMRQNLMIYGTGNG